jgi:hypothetical protein
MVGVIGDRMGQLRKNREDKMGRLRVVWIVNLELQGGSPRLCQLRTTSIGSEWTSIWNVLTHTGHMESLNWVASYVDELDDTLPHFTSVQWDSVWATHGMSTEAYTWKTTLGWGRTWPSLLITSWIVATRGASGSACVMLSGLYPCKVEYQFESPQHP